MRQGNIVAAMLNNWKDAEAALQTAMNSEGSALREHAKAMDTVEAKSKEFSASMNLMWQNAFNSDAFKNIIGIATKLADAIGTVVQKFGLLPVVISAITVAFLALNNGWQMFLLKGVGESVQKWTEFNSSVKLATASLFGNKIAQETLQKASIGTQITVKALSLAFGTLALAIESITPIALIFAATYAIQKLTESWHKHNEEVKKAQEEIQTATKAYNDNRQEIQDLQKEYNKLSGPGKNLNTDEFNRLVEIQDKLAKLLPDVAVRFDEQGHAILRASDSVNEYIGNINKLADLKLDKQRNDLTLSFNEIDKRINNTNKKLKETKSAVDSPTNTYVSTSNDMPIPIVTTINKSVNDQILDKQRYIDAQIEEENNIQDLTNYYNDSVQAQLNGQKVLEKLTKTDLDYVKSLAAHDARLKATNQTDKTHIELVNDEVAVMIALARARDIMNSKPTYDTVKTASGVDTGILDTYDYRLQLLDATFKLAGIDSQYAAQLMSSFTEEAKKAITATFDIDVARTDLLKTTEDFIGAQKELAQTYYKLNNNQDLALNDIIAMLAKTPELTSALKENHGMLTLEASEVLKVAKVKEAAFKAELKQKETLLLVQKEHIAAQIQNALKEIGLIKTVADVRAGADGMLQDQIDKEAEAGFGLDPETQLSIRQKNQGYQDLVNTFKDANKALEDMQKTNNILSGIDFTTELGKETKSSGSDNSIPYDLKDYQHQDQLLANQVESFKYQAEQFANKLDQSSMAQFKSFVNQQVNTYQKRIKLANEALPGMRQDAEGLLASYNGETDQSKKNEFGRKYDDQVKTIQTIENSLKDWENAVKDLTVVQEKDKYVVDQYTASLEKLDQQLAESKNTQSQLKSDSKEYRDELTKQNGIISQKMNLIAEQLSKTKLEIAVNKELLNSGELLQTQFNELLKTTDEKEQKVRQLTSAYTSLRSELIQNTEEMKNLNKEWYQKADDVATKVIDGIKKALGAEKDLAIKAIDAIMEKEQEQHDLKTKQLDEELSQYEEIINARLKSIDDQTSKDDYEKQLSKAQKDRAETQKKIDLLSMDNSPEAQAKLADLKKKLADQDEAIADMKKKRDTDLRKENLKNLLDDKQKDIKETKKAEDEKYEASKKALEKMKADVEAYFNELINDEQRFAKIRKDILSGNVAEVNKELESYSKTFQGTTTGDFTFLKTQLGTYWEEFNSIAQGKLSNIKGSINEALSLAKELQDLINGTVPAGGTAPEGGTGQVGTPPTPVTPPAVTSDNDYLTAFREYIKNKVEWETANDVRKNELHDRNKYLREKWGFYDYTYQQIKDLQLEKFRDGGYTSDSEGLAILHKRELVLNAEDTKNFLAAAQIMRTSVSMMKQPSNSDSSRTVEINIENLHIGAGATKQDADDFLSRIGEGLKKKGV